MWSQTFGRDLAVALIFWGAVISGAAFALGVWLG